MSVFVAAAATLGAVQADISITQFWTDGPVVIQAPNGMARNEALTISMAVPSFGPPQFVGSNLVPLGGITATINFWVLDGPNPDFMACWPGVPNWPNCGVISGTYSATVTKAVEFGQLMPDYITYSVTNLGEYASPAAMFAVAWTCSNTNATLDSTLCQAPTTANLTCSPPATVDSYNSSDAMWTTGCACPTANQSNPITCKFPNGTASPVCCPDGSLPPVIVNQCSPWGPPLTSTCLYCLQCPTTSPLLNGTGTGTGSTTQNKHKSLRAPAQ